MNQIEALTKIQALGHPLFRTKDVAAALAVTGTNANKIITRLADAGFVISVARGRWAIARDLNKLLVPEALTAPYPAYISLQTALYRHGMISQIPVVTYSVSLARTHRYDTPVGVFSIHHVTAEFFFGFERDASGAHMAVPEKALVDVLYLSPTRTRLFVRLPELDVPKMFSWARAAKMVSRINGQGRRRLVEEKLTELRRGRGSRD